MPKEKFAPSPDTAEFACMIYMYLKRSLQDLNDLVKILENTKPWDRKG